MSQFYGADEDLTSSKKDAENITQDEEFATDIDLAIENVEFDQLNLKENIDNPSNLHGQKISSTNGRSLILQFHHQRLLLHCGSQWILLRQ